MKERVLVVEDEDIVAEDVCEALESFGYELSGRASDGDSAVELAGEEKPDLVLMDIKLEGEKDGIQAADEIRKKFDIPIIFITAFADEETFARAKITEPYGYILKPYKELELKMAVELALAKHQSSSKAGRLVVEDSVEPEADGAEVASDTEVTLSSESEDIYDFLKGVYPFSEAKPSALKSLAQVARLVTHDAGSLIAIEGDSEVSGFVVLKGRVALVKASPSGKDLIVELLPPGDPFGLVSTIDQDTYSFTIRAQIESELLWLPRSKILQFLDEHAELGREFLTDVFSRLRRSHDFSRALAHDRVEVRIAHALVSIVPKFSSAEDSEASLGIEMSRQEMADIVGTAPETVIRSMKKMEKDGLLDLSELGFVKVLDLNGLKELSEP